MELEPMIFDEVEPVIVPVKIGKKDYVLRQADEGAASKYLNARSKSLVIDQTGKRIGVDGMHDAFTLLVSLCLFEVYQVGAETKERPVLLATIKTWPHKRVWALYQKAVEISELEEDEGTRKKKEEASKNGQSGGEHTSSSPMNLESPSTS